MLIINKSLTRKNDGFSGVTHKGGVKILSNDITKMIPRVNPYTLTKNVLSSKQPFL